MANENEYSTIDPTSMQLCEYSDYYNTKRSEWNLFLLTPLQNCIRIAPVASFHCLLLNNIPRAIVFAAIHEKRATVNATADRTEVLGAWRMERKLFKCCVF